MGMQDEKMKILHEFAKDLGQVINGKGYNAGPHLAISVFKKTLYVAVNTKLPSSDTDTMISRDQLEESVGEVLADQSIFTHAMHWLVTAGETAQQIFGGEDGGGILHGEMRIMHYLETNDLLEDIDQNHKHYREDGYRKVIRIGGTQLDCSDCHQREHGGRDQPNGHSITDTQFEQRDSYDARFADKGYQILSPGTHGRSFPGWRDPLDGQVFDQAQDAGPGDYQPQKNVTNPTLNGLSNQGSGQSTANRLNSEETDFKKLKVKRLTTLVDALALQVNEQVVYPGKNRSLNDKITQLMAEKIRLKNLETRYLRKIAEWESDAARWEVTLGEDIPAIDRQGTTLYEQYIQARDLRRENQQKIEQYTQRVQELSNLGEDTEVDQTDLKQQLKDLLGNKIGQIQGEHDTRTQEHDTVRADLAPLVVQYDQVRLELIEVSQGCEGSRQRLKEAKQGLREQKALKPTQQGLVQQSIYDHQQKKDEVVNQRNTIDTHTREQQAMTNQLIQKQQQLDQLTVQKNACEDRLADITSQIGQQEQQQEHQQEHHQRIMQDLTKLENDIDQLKKDLLALENVEQDAQSSARVETIGQLEKKQEEWQQLTQEQMVVQEVTTKINENLESLYRQRAMLTEGLTGITAQQHDTQEEVQQLQQGLDELGRVLRRASRTLTNLIGELRNLGNAQKTAQRELDAIYQEIGTLRATIQRLKEAQKLRTSRQKAVKKQKVPMEIKQRELEIILDDLRDLTQQLGEYQAELQELG